MRKLASLLLLSLCIVGLHGFQMGEFAKKMYAKQLVQRFMDRLHNDGFEMDFTAEGGIDSMPAVQEVVENVKAMAVDENGEIPRGAFRKVANIMIEELEKMSGSSNPYADLPTNPFGFVPITIGNALSGKQLNWKDPCFASMSLLWTMGPTNGTIAITTKDKADATCASLYTISCREHAYWKVFDVGEKHTIDVASYLPYEQSDLQSYGWRVFLWPLGPEKTVISVLNTVVLFMDPDPNMVEDNFKFFAEKMQWAMRERDPTFQNTFLNLTVNKDTIPSGSYMGVLRMDGLDPMIAWGTGGHTGHTTMTLWFDDELYVVESTDTPGPSFLTYWPPPYGIIRTPWQQWLTQALQAKYHVALIRLSPEYQSKFNETAAVDFFNKVQGMPYGWHNFIFSFLDTGLYNLPHPITPQLFEMVFILTQKIIPFDAQSSTYNMMIQGLNHRFNSNCTTLQCVFEIIDPLNMTLEAACAIPEQDSWTYGGNYSMVCSAFVTEMYKNAGLFAPFTNSVQGTEHTPKDAYQLNLYMQNWDRPKECVEADPALPYCQILGKYVLTIPGYNEIQPYANQNQYCQAQPPQYWRGPPGC